MAKTTSAARRRNQHRNAAATSLTQLTLLDAIRTWVVPGVTLPAALIVYVLYNVEVLDREPSVSLLGLLTFATLLWVGLRGFITEHTSGRFAAVLAIFAVLWGAGTVLPFLAIINPGTPVFSAPLHPEEGVTLPLEGLPGAYRLVVEGNFTPSATHSTRLAHYRLALTGGGAGEEALEGSFSERFLQQRLGRRGSTTVRDLHTATQHSVTITEGEKAQITLKELAPPDTISTVALNVYAEKFPVLLFSGLAIGLVAVAMLIDSWRPHGQSQDLLTTVTLGSALSILALRSWGGPHPGFGQFAVEGLLGGVAGSLLAMVLGRIGRPLRRLFPGAP